MSAHTALTIAIAAAIFGVFVFVDVLRANRALPFFGPRVSESDEEGAAHCHAELDGAGLPLGLVGHFHTIHEEASK